MKKLSIEEKAQRYDEAIAVINKCETDKYGCIIGIKPSNIFPELKESEDETIRKEITELVMQPTWKTEKEFHRRKELCTWLEKQGEMDMGSYKTAEDEKREFVGDGFIKCYADFQDFKEGETYWLEYIGNDNYNVRSDNLLGKTYHITPCQLYTIFKKQTWLEKKGEQKPTNNIIETWKGMRLEVYQQATGNRHEPNYSDGTTKMFSLNDIDEIFEKIAETREEKSADNVEPKFKVGDTIRHKGNHIENTIISIDDKLYHFPLGGWVEIEYQNQWELVEQNPAWSEEDEKKRKGLIKGLEDRMGFGWACDPFSREEYIDWLNSLRPQNHWKPSEEQMEALRIVVENHCFARPQNQEYVKSLYNDLKKLREE